MPTSETASSPWIYMRRQVFSNQYCSEEHCLLIPFFFCFVFKLIWSSWSSKTRVKMVVGCPFLYQWWIKFCYQADLLPKDEQDTWHHSMALLYNFMGPVISLASLCLDVFDDMTHEIWSRLKMQISFNQLIGRHDSLPKKEYRKIYQT